MRKLLFIFVAFLLLILPVRMAVAETGESGIPTEEQYRQKAEIAKQLEADGTLDRIEKQRQEYYQKYKGQFIQPLKAEDVDSPEGQAILKQIINSMQEDTNGSKGSNNISFTSFWNGDLILVHDGFCPYGYYRHGGTYDSGSGKFVSAQASNQGYGKGVIWEPKSFYQNTYDEAVGLYVPFVSGNCSSMMTYLRGQLGEPYFITAFDDRTSWYCTKLPWVGYWDYHNININEWNFMMYTCYPDNIFDDNDTLTFAWGY